MWYAGRRLCVVWLILAAILGGAVAVSAAKATEGRVLDRVAARVNNEIITENELLVAAFGHARRTEGSLPGTMPDVRAVLQSMIDERLLAQAAREEIKEIPEEAITNRVEAIVKDQRAPFPTEKAFRAKIEEQGWDLESFKAYLREQEIRTYLIQAALARRAQARMTDQDEKAYVEELKRKGESLVQYRLRQILVAQPAQPTAAEAAQARQRMLGILEEVRKGVPFEQLARERSDDKATRASDGDLGWIAEKDLKPPILEAVRSLEKGQTSNPVPTEKGIHLFQLIRKRTVRDLLFEKRLEEARKTWVGELRRRAQIKILLPQLAE